MKKIYYILMITVLITSAMFMNSCDSRGYEYDIPTTINFEGLDNNNIVQLAHGVTSFRVKGHVTCQQGIKQFGIYNANPKSGIPENNPITGTEEIFDENYPLEYNFDYIVENIESNKALRIKIVSGEDESFQAGVAITITPVVEFTLERTLESYDYWYGMYLATWYEGRVYKHRDVEQWASQVDISMGEVDGKPCFVSPDARAQAGRESYMGAKKTRFAQTTLTAAEFNAIKEVDASPLQGISASAEIVKISANTVYAYVTAEGKKGLILVTALANTPHRDLKDITVYSVKLRVKKEL